MKHLLLLLVFTSILMSGCEKEQNRKLLGAYFRYTVNGQETLINDGSGVNNNFFDCTFRGDTALYINVSKLYEGVGFVVKGHSLGDGTYILNDRNRAYYTNPKDNRRYYTNDQFKGSLKFKKGTFQAKTLLNTLEGEFSFTGVDTATNKTFTITNGTFLMERK